ncbi:hypothetical protein LSCM4_00123 [Leishmania orientalis]|uniref:Uncharacterized protein n=1 Tax=Leishmania orientalis TaxID=2249476 RepID=A0A836GV40_9TRYP|nr:hypothetical protein LSCM4_00123 [Leishmania orientalis]
MKATTKHSTPRPPEAVTPAYVSNQTRDDDCEEGTRGGPVRQDSWPEGTTELHLALESLTSLPAPNRICGNQSNFLPGNPLGDREDSASMPWGAEHDDATTKLSPMDLVEGGQPPFPIWNIARDLDSCAGGGDSVAVPFEAPRNDQERSICGVARPKTTPVARKCDTSLVGTLASDFSVIWQPQGLLGGALEKIDSREANVGARSMPAMVLNGEAPDDLPHASSPYSESHSHPSTPLVNAIQLHRHCMTMTPFMSVSSIFSASARSMSLVRTSVQQLMGNTQHSGASAAHAASQEVPPVGSVGDSEPCSSCALPLQAGSALALGALEKTKLGEENLMCISVQESESSVSVLPLDLSVISAANSTATAQQASPHNPCAPTLPCTPVANGVSCILVKRCILEERQARYALAKGEATCFESILRREVSAYLILTRQQRKATRQHSEYTVVAEQRNHLQNAASRFHDMMRARMGAKEAEHQMALKTYQSIEPVPVLSVGERAPKMRSAEDQADMSDTTRSFPSGALHFSFPMPSIDGSQSVCAPPWQPSHDARSTAPLGAPKFVDRLLSSEIQRQLRLGRQPSQKADAWTAEVPFTELS